MQIKLPHMPFRFNTPEGMMEITVRQGPANGDSATSGQFNAAAAFLQAGPRALVRVPLAARAKSHHEAMRALTTGFKVNPAAYGADSVEQRVLLALCKSAGVVQLDD